MKQTTMETTAKAPGQEAEVSHKTPKTLTIAYSGDPDDAFAFYGLETGAIKLSGNPRIRFVKSRIQELNESAVRGDHEVTAISSAAYPLFHERYFISSAGSSVGRNYGPMLASKRYRTVEQLRGKRVASPGPLTTGNLLLWMELPDCELVYMPFDRIREALEREEIDAGVLIHEELLNYRKVGLNKVRCLGEAWFEKTGLPLPVGLNVIRRDVGPEFATELVDKIRASIRYGLDHSEEALRFANAMSIALDRDITVNFVKKFANDDTIDLDGPTRQALRILLDAACRFHSVKPLDTIDIV